MSRDIMKDIKKIAKELADMQGKGEPMVFGKPRKKKKSHKEDLYETDEDYDDEYYDEQ